MKKLLVVAETYLDKDNGGTQSIAFNQILNAYSNYFDKIITIVPSKDKNEEIFEISKIRYYSVNNYNRSWLKRIKFIIYRKDAERKISQIINEEKPTLIQLRIPSVFDIWLFRCINKLGIPITTYVGGEWDEALTLNYSHLPFIKVISAKLFNIQNSIISKSIPVCAGDHLKERFLKINPKAYAYYSTTHNKVHFRNKRNNYFNLMIVGRLEKLKRVEDAILATHILIQKNKNYKLSILGDGKERDELMNLTNSLNLQNNVIFYGNISDKTQLHELYMKNDILIHPSLSEGTSKVLAESMSYGLLPIAVKDVGSNNYILSNKRGYLVNPKSHEEIATKILHFNSASEESQNEYINEGYIYAKRHTIDKELDKMWSFIFENINSYK